MEEEYNSADAAAVAGEADAVDVDVDTTAVNAVVDNDNVSMDGGCTRHRQAAEQAAVLIRQRT